MATVSVYPMRRTSTMTSISKMTVRQLHEQRCRMPFAERRLWLLRHLVEERFLDVLDTAFVEQYVGHTGARYFPSPWGAGWCKLLNSDLLRMYRRGELKRSRASLGMSWQPGLPKWVYSYSLKRPVDNRATDR